MAVVAAAGIEGSGISITFGKCIGGIVGAIFGAGPEHFNLSVRPPTHMFQFPFTRPGPVAQTHTTQRGHSPISKKNVSTYFRLQNVYAAAW